ncbi:MAG: sigma-70 family RNA polymerase sigma factor [Planctomycetes bacterium]|nr:sigma-70 family RNA polymerase sigma factor [Planctomycetota bacterium]
MEGTLAEVSHDDEQLANLIARRDRSDQAWEKARAACGRLYSRHAPRLLAFLAGRVNPSDVEDIHQAIWQRVWERWPRGFEGGHFRGWLYQIARHLAIDQGRKKRPQLLGESEPCDPHKGEPEETLHEEERMAALRRCLEQLGPDEAAVVRARLAGESYEEIAARLGLEVERAYRLFHQAKERLQACVQRVLG